VVVAELVALPVKADGAKLFDEAQRRFQRLNVRLEAGIGAGPYRTCGADVAGDVQLLAGRVRADADVAVRAGRKDDVAAEILIGERNVRRIRIRKTKEAIPARCDPLRIEGHIRMRISLQGQCPTWGQGLLMHMKPADRSRRTDSDVAA